MDKNISDAQAQLKTLVATVQTDMNKYIDKTDKKMAYFITKSETEDQISRIKIALE
jgi:predicted metal-dependent peptidase